MNIKRLLILILFSSNALFAMDIDITPDTILQLAPSMPDDLEKETTAWLQKNTPLVTELTSRPRPLTFDAHTAKKERIQNAIKENPDIKQLSPYNYILQDNDHFLVQIVEWRRLLAHLVYVTGQGDVTKEKVDSSKLDWNKIEAVPQTFMTVGRVATYIQLARAAHRGAISELKIVPTYLKHIPNQSTVVADENYVAVQEYVPNVRVLKEMPEEEQINAINNLTPDQLRDLYNGIQTAGLWDAIGNMGIDTQNQHYFLDYEPTIFHHPNDFFFKGNGGKTRLLSEAADGIERVRQRFAKGTQRTLEHWEQIVANDFDFIAECEKQHIVPSIILEQKAEKK